MKITWLRANFFALAIIVIVLVMSFPLHALSAPGRNSIVTPGGQATPCTYDNYIDGSTYLGKDCKTGDNKFSETTAFKLWSDELASGVNEFWEGGTYDFTAGGGTGAVIIDLNSISIWGIYNQTIFKCSVNSCTAFIVGNQNTNDANYHANSIFIKDIVFDAGYPGTGSTASDFTISNALDVVCDHCIFQNAGNIGGGTVAMAVFNGNQGGSQDIWIRNSYFNKQKLSLEGVRNGGIVDSYFTGTAPGIVSQALVAFSVGDIFPLSTERLEDFHFDRNHIIGWTAPLMDGFQSISNSTVNYNYFGPDQTGANSFSATFKSVAVTGPRLNGLTIQGNIFNKGTGTMKFTYGNNIRIIDNVWTHDSTPGGCTIAIQISPGTDHSQGVVNNVTITGNTLNAWGGAGIDANFTRGTITNNVMYNLNQGNCNANSDAGILIENQLNNALISGNSIQSTPASGAGVSRPIYYNGAAKNLLITNNYLIETADGSTIQGFASAVTVDNTVKIYNNAIFNPYGKITNPFVFAFVGLCGTGVAPAASTAYVVCTFPIIVTSTGGTGVSITIQDANANNVASGLTTLTAQLIPIGYKINFGAFSVAPTVTVFGA